MGGRFAWLRTLETQMPDVELLWEVEPRAHRPRRARIECRTRHQVEEMLSRLRDQYADEHLAIAASAARPGHRVTLTTATGARLCIQIGTRATTALLETPSVTLSGELAERAGATVIDCAMGHYAILDRCRPDTRKRFRLDVLRRQFQAALADTEDGHLDPSVYRGLSSALEKTLAHMARIDSDALWRVLTGML